MRRRNPVILPFAIVAVLSFSVRVEAQTAKRLELKPPTATHAEEFTSITSVRELRDGRLMVTDGREQRIVVLDFAQGSAAPVGTKGRGPGEYSMVAFLHPIGGDSTMMWDLMARRWLVFEGAKAVVTVPPDDPAIMAVGSLLNGADQLGRVLAVTEAQRAAGVTETGREDSSIVALVTRATGKVDTVARTLNVPRRIELAYKPDGTVQSSSFRVLGVMPAGEQYMLFPDGWLAIARLYPFRVDWRSPTGAWTRGAPLPVRPIPFDSREKQAYEARRQRNLAAQGPRPAGLPPAPPPPTDFPEFVPPFQGGLNLTRGPAGVLLIKRAPSADVTGNNYFVIDRAGRLVGEIVLPLERAIVGSGPNALYVSVKDQDDVLRVQRHPWP